MEEPPKLQRFAVARLQRKSIKPTCTIIKLPKCCIWLKGEGFALFASCTLHCNVCNHEDGINCNIQFHYLPLENSVHFMEQLVHCNPTYPVYTLRESFVLYFKGLK